MKLFAFTIAPMTGALLTLSLFGSLFCDVSHATAAVITGGTASISLTNSVTNASTADRFFTGNDAATMDLAALEAAAAVTVPRSPNAATMNISESSVNHR